MTVSGLMVGLAGTLLSSRIIGSFLFGISAVDLPIYAGAAILVVFVSLASSVFSLVRALAIDPIEVLRS